MSREIDTENWVASLFSQLIQRGIDCDEHIHLHGSPLDGCSAPSLEELRKVNMRNVYALLSEYLLDHRDDILRDYEKLEGGLHAPPRDGG